MRAEDVVRSVVAQLPAGVRARLAGIQVRIKAEPDAEDFACGATTGHRGYFYGTPFEPCESTELPDEQPPAGRIVLFTNLIKPLTSGEVTRTLLHEIGHVLGYEEEQLVHEMGL